MLAALLLTGTVVIIALCVREAAQVADPPKSQMPFEHGTMRVNTVIQGDLLDLAGIKPGDRILAINGTHFASGKEVTAFFLDLRPGRPVQFLVERDGATLTLEATALANLRGRKALMAGLPIIVLLLVGGGVFFAGQRDWPSLLFLLFCTTTAVNDACHLQVLGGSSTAQHLIVAACTLFSIQSPAIGLHLFTCFPARGRVQRWLSWWLPAAYAIQTALGLSFYLPAYSQRWSSIVNDLGIQQPLLELFNINVVICSALSALSLAVMAASAAQERARLQARLLFFAFALLTVLQLGLHTLPLRLTGRMPVSADVYGLVDLVVPIFVAVAILFHRLFGIDVLVRHGFIYGLSSTVLATAFAVAVLGFGWLTETLWRDSEVLVVAVAAGLAMLLFQPVQRRARRWVDRVLYHQRHSYHQLVDEISRQLATIFSLNDAALLLRTRIEDALQPETADVVVLRSPPPSLEALDADGSSRVLISGDEAAALQAQVLDNPAPAPPAAEFPAQVRSYALVVPLTRGRKLLGAVLLGPRRGELPYRPEDVDFLAAVARITAPVFENAGLLDERADRERLALVGTATSAIAHELKNPLSAIKSTAAILRRRLNEDDRGQELTRVVEEEVDRLHSSVMQVLTYSRPQSNDHVAIDLAEILRQLVSVVAPDFARFAVSVELEVEQPEIPLRGDPEGLRQAVLNLLVNCREAMHDGGVVVLRLRPWRGEQGRFRGVVISVCDSGPGFAESDLERVFEPFFSNKRLGTGLGLANVRRVVEQHRGEVAATNRPQGGAMVSLCLPAADEKGKA